MSAELKAKSVVCLVPLGQQHCSPDQLICNNMRPRTTTARQNSISLHFPVQPVSLPRSPFFSLVCLSHSWVMYFTFLGLSFSISLSLSITVFNNVLVSSSLFPEWIPLENAFERKQLYTSLPLKLCWHLFQCSKPYNMYFQSFQTQTRWR